MEPKKNKSEYGEPFLDEVKYYLVDDFNYGEEPTSIIAEEKITQEEKIVYTFYLAHAYYNENRFILYEKTFIEPLVLAMSIGNEIERSAIIYDITTERNGKTK